MSAVFQSASDILTFSNPGGMWAALGAISVGVFIFMLALALMIYIYTAIAMMTIGKKLKVNPTWLAWIPVINVFYIPMLAGYGWYLGFLWLLTFIPFLGAAISIILTIWWWWKIAERTKHHGWIGILMFLPIINLVVMGFLAWGKK